MNLFTANEYYEVVYRDAHFSYMQFIRIDYICGTSYLTWKNMLTGEMYTLEESGHLGIRKLSGSSEAS
ncbi:hypothetical protein [Bacillus sp. B15-48]|uniref:hypothetical protein n=1 Tax=Bacillus sp. B15-48 TaxID=1548601 RepID=UPI00193F16A5|nr:hypothetical protein [Bacillus sp. B15-48]MBM4761959.1 hypothetical protein [Bacillus sp. B15-48]